jgi:ABC-2 type transport system ATP-binding protein
MPYSAVEISVSHLSKTYTGDIHALEDVSFNFDHNGIFSLIGKNGAGKTTLIRILSTQLLPSSGEAAINGFDILRQAREIREMIAAVPQEARAVPWMTPLQTITSYLMWRGYTHSESREMGKNVLRTMGMEEQEDKKNRNLSGGQKRKVLVATALASEATLIFLDEPTTGLDFISRKELWNLLSSLKRERLIFLTTHYLEEAETLGDLIGVMSDGNMVGFGSLDELRKKVRYPLSIKIFSKDFDVSGIKGEVRKVAQDAIQIYTSEDEAYELAETLLARHLKFTVQEINLNTIFESFVQGDELVE